MKNFIVSFLALVLMPLTTYAAAPTIDNNMNMEELQKLIASDGELTDFFGASVSISGDFVVVGAQYDDDTAVNSGSAYIYQYNQLSANFVQVAKLTASDADTTDVFGSSVSISGDVVVVGAPGDDDGGTGSGSVYLFVKPVSG